MKNAIGRFYDFLARPLFPSARLLLGLLVVPLLLSLSQPLWRISMTAPQYPQGLYLHHQPAAHRRAAGDGIRHRCRGHPALAPRGRQADGAA